MIFEMFDEGEFLHHIDGIKRNGFPPFTLIKEK
jgi:hypothetical protein